MSPGEVRRTTFGDFLAASDGYSRANGGGERVKPMLQAELQELIKKAGKNG